MPCNDAPNPRAKTDRAARQPSSSRSRRGPRRQVVGDGEVRQHARRVRGVHGAVVAVPAAAPSRARARDEEQRDEQAPRRQHRVHAVRCASAIVYTVDEQMRGAAQLISPQLAISGRLGPTCERLAADHGLVAGLVDQGFNPICRLVGQIEHVQAQPCRGRDLPRGVGVEAPVIRHPLGRFRRQTAEDFVDIVADLNP